MSYDLQAPVLTALRERFHNAHEATGVLKKLEHASRWWPRDLSTQALVQNAPISQTFLATVCHFADRFGAMPILFREAPRGSLAWRVESIYSRYAELTSTAGPAR
jgi:hypothetical protein